MASDRLKTELETYEKHKNELVGSNAGKFVVIHGNDILGVLDTYEDAVKAGCKAIGFGEGPPM